MIFRLIRLIAKESIKKIWNGNLKMVTSIFNWFYSSPKYYATLLNVNVKNRLCWISLMMTCFSSQSPACSVTAVMSSMGRSMWTWAAVIQRSSRAHSRTMASSTASASRPRAVSHLRHLKNISELVFKSTEYLCGWTNTDPHIQRLHTFNLLLFFALSTGNDLRYNWHLYKDVKETVQRNYILNAFSFFIYSPALSEGHSDDDPSILRLINWKLHFIKHESATSLYDKPPDGPEQRVLNHN